MCISIGSPSHYPYSLPLRRPHRHRLCVHDPQAYRVAESERGYEVKTEAESWVLEQVAPREAAWEEF